ncbi:hypothetical protein PR202_ga12550 [Eleusine coracana subsp. coracana]|uniref:Reverse transcriptase zinc-binding domain-containing protein n=1 Tax=Eleusine coracana subsp. coracana TaxID=191504 RepID=A0AAV5CCB9_ELECO|nr:hypothetical protein PR202_ga12550 [Eleusine coracana subsp. coracana]
MGCSIADLAPMVVASVPPNIIKQRTVAEALMDHSWLRDIQGGLGLIGLFKYFQLWDAVHEMVLSQEPDHHFWNLDASGIYSSKSAYKAFHNRAIMFEPWRRVWKSWAPPKCKMFLWLAIRNRCWTADRLARWSLPHLAQCPLCNQEDEMVQHLLTSCVFARQFWFKLLEPLGQQDRIPSTNTGSFADCWQKTIKKVPKDKRKGANTLIILAAWCLWKHRNACVFEGARPNINGLLREFNDEHHLWCLAEARGLRTLMIGHEVGLG